MKLEPLDQAVAPSLLTRLTPLLPSRAPALATPLSHGRVQWSLKDRHKPPSCLHQPAGGAWEALATPLLPLEPDQFGLALGLCLPGAPPG